MGNDKLRTTIKNLLEEAKIPSQAELSREIGVSKAQLSYWLSDTYTHNPRRLEAKLTAWLRTLPPDRAMTFRDHNRLLSILSILDDADDDRSIVESLSRLRSTTTTEG